MAKYFNVDHGLRGCYADGSNRVHMVTTRRELRAIIAYEAESYRAAGYIGASQKAIAYLANVAWQEAKKTRPAYLPYCLPLAPAHTRGSYSCGIFCSVASRADYVEFRENDCDN